MQVAGQHVHGFRAALRQLLLHLDALCLHGRLFLRKHGAVGLGPRGGDDFRQGLQLRKHGVRLGVAADGERTDMLFQIGEPGDRGPLVFARSVLDVGQFRLQGILVQMRLGSQAVRQFLQGMPAVRSDGFHDQSAFLPDGRAAEGFHLRTQRLQHLGGHGSVRLQQEFKLRLELRLDSPPALARLLHAFCRLQFFAQRRQWRSHALRRIRIHVVP